MSDIYTPPERFAAAGLQPPNVGGTPAAAGLANMAPVSTPVLDYGRQAMQAGLAPRPVEAPRGAFFSPSLNKMYVAGQVFDPEDARFAVGLMGALDAPAPPPPTNVAPDWRPVSKAEYGSYVAKLGESRGDRKSVV